MAMLRNDNLEELMTDVMVMETHTIVYGVGFSVEKVR